MKERTMAPWRMAWASLSALVMGIALTLPERVSAQVTPSPSRYGLVDADYEVFSGDVNADGHVDLLMHARNPFAFTGEVAPSKLQWNGDFLVASRYDGTYGLDFRPQPTKGTQTLWVGETHELIDGDVDGDGFAELLVRAKARRSLSVLLTTSPADGTPVLLQRVNEEDIGLDLGDSALDVELMDVDGNGTADLLVSRGALVAGIWHPRAINAAGVFARQQTGATHRSLN